MRQEANMFLPKNKDMQMITDKRKIDSGRGPEKTTEKKKLNSPVHISEGDEIILVHISFFRNFLNRTIFVVLVLKNVLVLR